MTTLTILLLVIVVIVLSLMLRKSAAERRRLTKYNKALGNRNTELNKQLSKSDEELKAEILEPFLDNQRSAVESLRQQLRNANTYAFRLPIGTNTRVVNSPIVAVFEEIIVFPRGVTETV